MLDQDPWGTKEAGRLPSPGLPFSGNLDYSRRYNDQTFPIGRMNCSDFLSAYSDFRDGVITDGLHTRKMREHLTRCLACARYDASVRHGVRAMGEIEPSPDFRDRLRERIAATADQPMEPTGTGAAGIAAALMFAAAVALLVYEGSHRNQPLPTAVAVDPARSAPSRPALPVVVVNPGVPFVTFTDLTVSPFRSGSGTAYHVQSEIPLGIWTNLPR